MGNELQHQREQGGGLAPTSVSEVRQQIQWIDQLLKEVMKKDVHYGTIPGTQKPALYKPGAEKIGLMFRLSASFEVDHEDQPGEHREYHVTCRLHARDGTPVGEGIGVCTTMEGKYRFRWENTGVAVPSEYWDTRDPAILGGQDHVARKAWTDDGRGGRTQKWMIFHRVDHDNPADYYNTAAKMAKKRAHVDSILTATAASDIFEQDTEDPETIPPEDAPTAAPRSGGSQNGNGNRSQPRQKTGDPDAAATDGQVRLLRARLKDSQKNEDELLERFSVTSVTEIRKGDVNDALDFLEGKETAES